MKKAEQVLFVVDDDPSMRTAIRELIEVVGLSCQTIGSGRDLLEAKLPDVENQPTGSICAFRRSTV